MVPMGKGERNEKLRAMAASSFREQAALNEALAIVRDFNARLSAKGTILSWPTIGVALISKHPWLIIACDACDTITDLDLRVKPRAPDKAVNVALDDIRCSRCNGHGRPRIVALSQFATI